MVTSAPWNPIELEHALENDPHCQIPMIHLIGIDVVLDTSTTPVPGRLEYQNRRPSWRQLPHGRMTQ